MTKIKERNKIASFITKKQARLGLTNIRKTRKLLGNGDNWIQDSFESGGAYCIHGANMEANGPGADIGFLALSLFMPVAIRVVDTESADQIDFDSIDGSMTDAEIICMPTLHIAIDKADVYTWNDETGRKFRQVAAVIDKAEAFLQEIIAR